MMSLRKQLMKDSDLSTFESSTAMLTSSPYLTNAFSRNLATCATPQSRTRTRQAAACIILMCLFIHLCCSPAAPHLPHEKTTRSTTTRIKMLELSVNSDPVWQLAAFTCTYVFWPHYRNASIEYVEDFVDVRLTWSLTPHVGIHRKYWFIRECTRLLHGFSLNFLGLTV